MLLKYTQILLLLVSSSLNSAEVKIALTIIPGVLDFGNSNAPYNKLIDHINKNINVDVKYSYMPSARANNLLNTNKVDCIFPIIPSSQRSITTLQSEPINGIKAYVFSRSDVVYTNIEQLTGKTVVYLRGYLFGDVIKLHPNIKFYPVTSQRAALGMLQKQRVDAYLDYLPDIRFAFTKKELDNLNYDSNSPVIEAFDRMECLDNEDSKQLLNYFNSEIERLERNGELKMILGDYYVPIK